MIKKIVTGALIVLLCAGMSCGKDEVPSNTRVTIDPSMKVACPALKKIDQTTITMGELFTEYSSLQGEYIRCAIRNDCLIEAVVIAESGEKEYTVSCPALKAMEKQLEE